MERNKIIIKIILIVLLLISIMSFDYYIYMSMQRESKVITNSVDFSEKSIFDFSRDYVENFFNYLQSGNYESAYEMLHDNCKNDLFNSNIDIFKEKIQSQYFNKELNNKIFEIKDSTKGNVNNEKIFHAYYEVNIVCNNSSLKDSSQFYKDKVILVDVVKVNEQLKLVLNLEQLKI